MNIRVLKCLKKLVNILRRKKVLQIDLSEKPILKVEQDRFQADLRIVNIIFKLLDDPSNISSESYTLALSGEWIKNLNIFIGMNTLLNA